MKYSIDQIAEKVNEQIGDTVESAVLKRIKPFTDGLFEQINSPKPNKMLGIYGEADGGEKYNSGFAKKAKDLFGNEGSDGGFDKLGDVLLGIKNNDFNILHRLEKDTMTTIEGGSGGFLLPSAFSNQIVDLMLEQEICRPKCKVYTLGRNKGKSITIPAVDDNDHSSNIGGITTYWKAEDTAYTESDVNIRQIVLTANKLTVLCDVSEELLHDNAVAAENLIGSIFAKALAFELDNVILNTGTGAGQPLGIPQSNAIIEVAKETEQDPDTLILANIEKIISRISPFSFPRSMWLTNLTCLPSLMHLNFPVGTGAIVYNVFNEVNNVWKLYGRELKFSEHMPILGDSGTIQLIDFSRYAILLLQDITVRSDSSLGFKSDKISFKASIRIDGSPLDNDVLTPKKGDTLSAFVKLGEV
ncbi:hypothetical protein ES705_09504 [subsurface metagenome]